MGIDHRPGRHPTSPNKQAKNLKLLLCAVVMGLGAVVHAQPFPSFLLDTGYVVGPDQTNAVYCASAVTDSTGLVVWNSEDHVRGCLTCDGRTSSSTTCIDISGPGERFGAQPLDAGKSPSGYLVVWRADDGSALMGAVVSLGGAVVLRETLARNTIGWPCANPAVAFDGTNYLVAWQEDNQLTGYSWVLCTRVSQSGQVLDWPPFKVCPAGAAVTNYVSLGYGDSCYLAAYGYYVPEPADSAGIWCSRILPSGVVLDSAGIPVRHRPQSATLSRQGKTAVAFDGQCFVVGWSEVQSPFEVRAARVTQSGVVLDPEGLTVGTSRDAPTSVSAASVCDTTILVWDQSWEDTVAVSGRRLSSAGVLLDTADIFITRPFHADFSYLGPIPGSVSRCGDGFLVVYRQWVDNSSHEYAGREVLGRLVSAAGQVLDTVGTLLSYAANYQTAVDAASDGESFLAVWTDLRAGLVTHDCAVYGMRFSNEGRALDQSSFRISQWASHAPSVAYGAGCYLVCWLTDFGEDSSQVWAARIGREGVLLDTNPIRIPGKVYDYVMGDPDVAFGDSLFLVVWHYGGHGNANGARVRADGVLLDSNAIRLETRHGAVNSYPRVASDGHDFLVVWEDDVRECVSALRVASTGQLLDTAVIVIDHCGAVDDPVMVAFGGGIYLVVSSSTTDEAWRVTPGGSVLDTIEWGKSLVYPQVAYDGTNFLLVGIEDSLFRAMRISPQGEVVDSLRFVIVDLRPESTYLWRYLTFGLTADLQGHVGMAFSTFESNPYVSQRTRVSAFPAVTDGVNEQASEVRHPEQLASIIRGTVPLVVSEPATLHDITGRKLCDMKPGGHDLRSYGPGVYFLRFSADGLASSRRLTLIR